jgi:hypothetical protein
MFLTEAGTAEAAVTVLAAADACAADAGVNLTNWDPVVGECLAKLREQLGDDAFEDAWERGRQLTAEEASSWRKRTCLATVAKRDAHHTFRNELPTLEAIDADGSRNDVAVSVE